MGKKWQVFDNSKTMQEAQEQINIRQKAYTDKYLTPRSKYDQMQFEAGQDPWYKQAGKAFYQGAERSLDTLGQIGARAQEAWGTVPQGTSAGYDEGIREREAQRRAMSEGRGWGAMGPEMAGEAATDPTSWTWPAKNAAWLARAWGNLWRGGVGTAVTVPATGGGDYGTEKGTQTAIGAAGGLFFGEAGTQLGKRGGAWLFDKATDISQTFAKRVLHRAVETLGRDKRFFDPDGRPTVELLESLHEQGTPWLKMTPDEQKAVQGYSNYLLSDPVAKTASQQQAMSDFEKTGITPAVPYILRNQENWMEFERISKDAAGGADVREHMHKNQLEIEDFSNKQIKPQLGGVTKTEYQTGESVFDGVLDFYNKQDGRISRLYSDIREEFGDDSMVRPSNLQDRIAYWWSEGDQLTGGVGSNIKKQMQTWGILDKEGQFLRGMTVTEAENLRKRLNQAWSSANSTQRKAIRDLKNAIDDDVVSGTGKDHFKEARDLHRAFMESIDGKKGRPSLIRQIMDGKIPFEKIADRVIAGDVDQFITLKAFILKGPNGEQVFNDLRTQIWEKAFEKGKQGLSNLTEGNVNLGTSGLVIYSAPQTAQFIRKNLPPELREVLWPDDVNDQINAFLRVTSKHMMPPRGVVNLSNTNPSLWQSLKGAGGIQGAGDWKFWMRKFIEAAKSQSTIDKATIEGRKIINPKGSLVEMLKRERTAQRQMVLQNTMQRMPLPQAGGRASARFTDVPQIMGQGVQAGKDIYGSARDLSRDMKLIDRLKQTNIFGGQ